MLTTLHKSRFKIAVKMEFSGGTELLCRLSVFTKILFHNRVTGHFTRILHPTLFFITISNPVLKRILISVINLIGYVAFAI